MNASDLYSQTLATLNAARNNMLSPSWQATLAGLNAKQMQQERQQLGEVQTAITMLSNAVLSNIVQQMNAQQAALKAANSSLTAALQDLTQFNTVVTAIATLLNVVATIVPLI